MNEATTPHTITALPYLATKHAQLTFSLFDVADDNGNAHRNIMYNGKRYTWLSSNSNDMTATYMEVQS